MIKKLLISAVLLSNLLVFAQVKLGGRSNLIYNVSKPSFSEIKASGESIYSEKGENNVGSNYGFFIQFNMANSLFIMPEAYYTLLTSSVLDAQNHGVIIRNSRIDVPVLVGQNFLGNTLSVFAGPVASYKLNTNNVYAIFREKDTKSFTIGYQFGAQFKLGNLLFNARYEGAFDTQQREFINTNVGEKFLYDERPSLLIVGIGFMMF